MTTTSLQSTPALLYEGSVKTLYQDLKDSGVCYFQYSDDYSVFDWGKMPDAIANKGRALSLLGGFFFTLLQDPQQWQCLKTAETLKAFDAAFLECIFSSETYQQLSRSGLAHHFLGWTSSEGSVLDFEAAANQQPEAPWLKVKKVNVFPPEPFTLNGQTLYEYPRQMSTDPFLIPLEVVFRFGMPLGSSLEKRLQANPTYAAQLGLSQPLSSETLFAHPVVEFFTKLEPTDRFLMPQEAFLMSGLTGEAFKALSETTLLVALWLYAHCQERGLTLWDGKFEFAWTSSGLMLVDSIGPDELRLTCEGVQLSKEVARQIYRDTPWEKAAQQAKKLVHSRPGEDWKALCMTELQQQPLPLSDEHQQLMESLYGALGNTLMGQLILPQPLSLEEVIAAVKELTR